MNNVIVSQKYVNILHLRPLTWESPTLLLYVDVQVKNEINSHFITL